MIAELDKIKEVLKANRSELAFVVGNGINRFAYAEEPNVSWEGLLLDVWQQISCKTLSGISPGVSLTEFYDIMEMEKGAMKGVKQLVIDRLGKWEPTGYHQLLQEKMKEWHVPLLTTNFDRNLEEGLQKYKLGLTRKDFTDYYPWNVYFSHKVLASPINGFGVWHINGTIDYLRSIKLGLSDYVATLAKVRSFVHKADGSDDFRGKDQIVWRGYNTWLHIVFNCSLCIFGLALDENETFLRWLLIERAKYFRKFPERKKKGWYVCKTEEISEGKRFYLDSVGFEVVKLRSWEEIYKGVIDLNG